jgi:sugar phosphate isomerase/epimerase
MAQSHIEVRVGGAVFGCETVAELRRALDLAEQLGKRVVVAKAAKRSKRLTAEAADGLTEAQRLARNEASRKAKAAARKASKRKGCK